MSWRATKATALGRTLESALPRTPPPAAAGSRRLVILCLCYLVLNRGPNREVACRAEDDSAYFVHLLQRYRERFALRLYRYCLRKATRDILGTGSLIPVHQFQPQPATGLAASGDEPIGLIKSI